MDACVRDYAEATRLGPRTPGYLLERCAEHLAGHDWAAAARESEAALTVVH